MLSFEIWKSNVFVIIFSNLLLKLFMFVQEQLQDVFLLFLINDGIGVVIVVF